MENFETIKLNLEKDFAKITLHRPERLNTINGKMIEELGKAIEKIEGNDNIKAILITGSGKAFCAGADVSWLASPNSDEIARMVRKLQYILLKLQLSDKISIASVNGPALGGGCEIALACDIRIASKNAVFGQPEINFGIIPGAGGTQRLPRIAGSLAMELILTGRHISADEAYRIGLVSRVVDDNRLHDESMKLVDEILLKPRIALRCAKKAVLRGYGAGMLEGIEYELEMFSIVIKSEEAKYGLNAFAKEKRIPYKGGW